MATGSIRRAVVTELTSRFAAALTGYQVLADFPGEAHLKSKALWCGDIEGQFDYPLASAPRNYRDDTFDMTWWLHLAGLGADIEVTHTTITTVVAAIDGVIADAPNLSNLDGLIEVSLGTVKHGVTRTPEGPVGGAEIHIVAHSRLH